MDRPYNFGPDGRLAGVWTPPDPGASRPNVPAVVLPNAYVTPHTGLFRLHVELARHLATLGFGSLRFDVSGIGDSVAHPEAASYVERVPRDLATALDFAKQISGAPELLLIGHCNGANHAFRAALDDERVRGLVLIDAFMKDTWRYHLSRKVRHWRQRFDPRRVLVRAPAGDEAALGLNAVAGEELVLVGAEDRSDLGRQCAALRERGTRLLWVFSGDFKRQCGLAELRRIVDLDAPEVPDGELRYFDASHVYDQVAHREALVEGIGVWLGGSF
jgi:alpha/beta superfamily hydrolase